jgi:hypothetical protein
MCAHSTALCNSHPGTMFKSTMLHFYVLQCNCSIHAEAIYTSTGRGKMAWVRHGQAGPRPCTISASLTAKTWPRALLRCRHNSCDTALARRRPTMTMAPHNKCIWAHHVECKQGSQRVGTMAGTWMAQPKHGPNGGHVVQVNAGGQGQGPCTTSMQGLARVWAHCVAHAHVHGGQGLGATAGMQMAVAGGTWGAVARALHNKRTVQARCSHNAQDANGAVEVWAQGAEHRQCSQGAGALCRTWSWQPKCRCDGGDTARVKCRWPGLGPAQQARAVRPGCGCIVQDVIAVVRAWAQQLGCKQGS